MAETEASTASEKKRFVGAGGTAGGLGEFFLGVILAGIGGYLFTQQVQVHTSWWRMGGLANSFGLSLMPMLIGIGVLFFNGKSVVGWLFTVGGFLFIVVGVMANMDIYFARTSLFNTLLMLGLLAGGMGLIFRSLRAH